MDEAEKYQQRLQAIAEKRRLQEEQNRAKRDLEEEKLRLLQLKRKSLRDQWLMEGPPLSPTSPDRQPPHSPLWGSQAQEIEQRIHKLQTESQHLTEQDEKQGEQMEDGQMDAETAEEGVQGAVLLEKRQEKDTGNGAVEDEVKEDLRSLLDGAEVVLTNGGGEGEGPASHIASEENTLTNHTGPVPDGAIGVTLLGYSEAEPDTIPNAVIDKEEEAAGTLVIRAERVIITDEGDEAPVKTSPEGEGEAGGELESVQHPSVEPPPEGGDTVGKEEKEKTETVSEPSAEPEREKDHSDAVSRHIQGDTSARNREIRGEVKTDGAGDGVATPQGRDTPSSEQLQSPADAVEGATVASVPVYSEAQIPSLTPGPEVEVEVVAEVAAVPENQAPEGVEVSLAAQVPATLAGQFQEVSLAEPYDSRRTETVEPGEQEPFLSQTRAEPLTSSVPASTETHPPTRGAQGGQTPKRKSCHCCSVM